MHNISSLETAAAIELAERKRMALRIFRPQPHQEPIFEAPLAKYSLIQGGNRSGKSTCAAVQFASIATDTPITLADGREIDQRAPWQKGRSLVMYVVGYQERHIGETIYRLLFKRGLFKVVHDPKTKELRSFDPDNDPALGLKPQDSPPLIPARFIKKFSWNVAADNIFTKVILHNPKTKEEIAQIFAYSSQGLPKAGDPVDFVWVDERIGTDGYIDEMKARLVDKSGQLVWSSWPDVKSDDLRKFVEVVDRAEEEGKHDIARKTLLPMSSNKHLGKKAIEEFLAGCATPEEALARDKGIFVTDMLRMYPLFDRAYHSAIREDEDADKLSKILKARDGIPPNDWTKTLVLDPGTSNPAVLLCAVPPPDVGEFYVAYQEFYPGRFDAIQLAQLIKKETEGQYFRQFLCDRRAGRQTPMGMRARIVDSYEEAWLEAGLQCSLSKHKFQMASDDVGGRQMILQGLMHPGKTGLPKLRIVTHRCPQLCRQLEKVKKQVVSKEVRDERKAPGQPHDVLDCLEYFAASKPRYQRPVPTPEQWPDSYRRYMQRIGNKDNQREVQPIGTFC